MTAINNVNFPANERHIQGFAPSTFRRGLLQGSQRSFRCVENISFIEAYPITTLFLTVMTGGLAIFPLAFMRTDRIIDRCNFQGRSVQQEKVPFMQKHPITSLFLIVVTGGLALLILPFATSNIDRCQQGHLLKHVYRVPFVAEYPITSIFMACLSGGLAIIPLVFMKATHSSDWE